MTKYFTYKGLEKIKKELNYLETVKRKEIAAQLKHAASFGDLSDNAGYQIAKETQAFLEDKILELKELICSAKVIEKRKTDRVQMCSIVLVVSDNQKQKFQIVEPEESNLQERKISFKSPLGKAFLGKYVGAKIKIKTPGGEIQYEILEIE